MNFKSGDLVVVDYGKGKYGGRFFGKFINEQTKYIVVEVRVLRDGEYSRRLLVAEEACVHNPDDPT